MEENFKYSFGGMSMPEYDKDLLNKEFDCIYDNGCDRTVYLSKETYDQGEEDEEYNFKYKFSIVEETYDVDDKAYISINLVPTLDSLSEEKFNDIAEYSGIDRSEINYEDMHFMGGYEVCLSGEEITLEEDKGYWDSPTAIEKLNIAANAVSTINALRGFYLDKPQNMLGLTGWDFIYQNTRNEDYWEQVQKRAKEYEEDA